MRLENINKATREAERFLVLAQLARDELTDDAGHYICGTATSGALRRASMDLTRALSVMRRPN